MRCHLVSVNSVYGLSYRLGIKILKSGYRPDTIVAISRGGFAPARFLCDFLRVSDMLSIRVQHYKPGAEKMEQAVVKYPLPSGVDLHRSKVLIVDDVNDTGESLRAAFEHVTLFRPVELKTAVLHQKETTIFNADYFEILVKKWLWIVYPWAATEDIGSFLEKIQPLRPDMRAVAQKLREAYGIRINLSWLQKITSIKRLQ